MVLPTCGGGLFLSTSLLLIVVLACEGIAPASPALDDPQLAARRFLEAEPMGLPLGLTLARAFS